MIYNSFVKTVYIGAVAALLFAFAITADAQCGGAFDEMAANAASPQKTNKAELISALSGKVQGLSSFKSESDQNEDASIVGLWHILFNISVPGVPDPITIQEAFQIWNFGGTEVHNPKVDPRGGSVCLGAWKEARGTYRLTHRVWSYSPDGVFLGTINLAESVRVTNRGQNQTGTFTLDFFDPDGNPLAVPGVHPAHVDGVVVAERISGN